MTASQTTSTTARVLHTAIASLAIISLAACSGRGGGAAEHSDEDYPSSDITLVVPYSAGGNTDIAARALAPSLEEELGVSVIVENREGASGTTGAEYVAGQAPDGYTVGLITIDSALWKHQGYDLDPFGWDHISQIAASPSVIAVGPDSPYENLDDLISAAKEAPDTVTIGMAGAGTNPESVLRELEQVTGASFRAVPFDGGAPTVTAVMGDQVDAVIAGTGETTQHHADGLLRVISVLTEERNPRMPDVSTSAEQGYDILNSGWTLLVTPKETPQAVQDRLRAAAQRASESDEYVRTTEQVGNLALYREGDALEEFLHSEVERIDEAFGS